MTLQIALTPEMEAKLRERAAALGKDPASFVQDVVEYELGIIDASDSAGPKSRFTKEQRIAELEAWAASHAPLPYEVDDSRESIYEGRGE